MQAFRNCLFSLVLPAVWLVFVSQPARAENSYSHLVLVPDQVTLQGKAARQQVTLSGVVEGRTIDLTRKARFESQTPEVVEVDSGGLVRPVGDGTGIVVATVQDARVERRRGGVVEVDAVGRCVRHESIVVDGGKGLAGA